MNRKYLSPTWIAVIVATAVIAGIGIFLIFRFLVAREEPLASNVSPTPAPSGRVISVIPNDLPSSSHALPVPSAMPPASFKKLNLPNHEVLHEDSTAGYASTLIKVSGEKLVYFVADIRLNDITALQAAFAQGKFGTNITDYTTGMAQESGALIAINCDNYGFRKDGIVIRNGVLHRNKPTKNKAMVIYKDGTAKTFIENSADGQSLLDQGAWQSYTFGPVLVESGEVQTVDIGKSSLKPKNPRTGIGYVEPNHFVFVVVDGRKMDYSIGMTLDEFAKLFKDMGCELAYNFDGGQTSSMAYKGELVNNPLGNNSPRKHSDILFIK